MPAVISYSARDGKLFPTNADAKAHDQRLDNEAVLMLTTVHIDAMYAGNDKGSIELRDAFIRVAGRLNAAKPADQKRTRGKKAASGETATPGDDAAGQGDVGASEAAMAPTSDGEGDELVEGEAIPATRYFHHPESEALFTTTDGSRPIGDGLVEEIDRDAYARLLVGKADREAELDELVMQQAEGPVEVAAEPAVEAEPVRAVMRPVRRRGANVEASA